jgi:4-hydroxy-tetrahydrodipicolinate reductase
MLKLLILGNGRMGRLVQQHAAAAGFEVAAVLDVDTNAGGQGITDATCAGVDVAIDFTTAAAVLPNLAALAPRGVNVVLGTTGWGGAEAEARALAGRHGIGVVASANFSLGANLLAILSERAAALFGPHADYGAFVYEQHHAAKLDAPSGTALMLRDAMVAQGYGRTIDVAATRAGFIPGLHTVGFDGPAETVTLTHNVRDRSTFAHGALAAAKWLCGRRGWFTMRDVLGVGGT